ncbi:kinase-like protein [Gigaspora margarita]|uniref:Kinase-like protein n=1 Tax=Gigaspora margarita TaxID=4874 RepID=A0A8H4AU49_GIGMA|nr:kinase-like protein [Gigaspora margarita]
MDRVSVAEQAAKILQIKEFIKDVSELQGYRKFVHSRTIKEKFENIVKEFETVMGDLHFTISVTHEEQRKLDHEALEQDISDMNKKIYKFCEVACKPIVIPKDYEIKAQRFYVRFAILEGNIVMVNEWTEMGTLREVYEKYDITWIAKVHIATDICRGITFLHSCDILHHDIRCENILMTRNLEPKITKFEYSSYVNRDEELFKMTNDNVCWMAPEILRKIKFLKYNFKCEIFRIYQKPLSSPALLPPNTLDLDGSMKKIYDSSSNEGDTSLPNLDVFAIEPLMPLETVFKIPV